MGPAPAGPRQAPHPQGQASSETDDERTLHSHLPVIDEYPGMGNGAFATLRLSADSPSPEIWFHHFKREPADIDYCGYLDALTVTKSVSGWQYLFADVDLSSPEFGHARHNMEHMLDVLPELFPEHDYAPFQARLNERL
ncbi:hypothetical protein [Actinomadura sp. NPDC048394]|uniref:hypothetical protein n=1 Tax=Actinomadura sp. NPDC048394 TaxID=3158223 RepID=UPI0033D7161F